MIIFFLTSHGIFCTENSDMVKKYSIYFFVSADLFVYGVH